MAEWYGKPHAARAEVVKYFHSYIKEHNLKVIWHHARERQLVTVGIRSHRTRLTSSLCCAMRHCKS